MTTRCANCGLPAHRYGTGDRNHTPDKTACINGLRHRLRKIQAILDDIPAEGTTMEATAEERTKVARDECRTHGHTYDVIGVMDGYPVKLLCTVCGSSWRLHPDDEEKVWGTE